MVSRLQQHLWDAICIPDGLAAVSCDWLLLLMNYWCHKRTRRSCPAGLKIVSFFNPHHCQIGSVYYYPQAASWLSVVPSPSLNLHLDTTDFQIAVKWWLMDVSMGFNVLFVCSNHWILYRHTFTCKFNGDVVAHYNRLHDAFCEFCRQARIGGQR